LIDKLKILNIKNKLIDILLKYYILIYLKLGIGDWGLGIGDWGLGPIPNPQSPIPHPQSPNFLFYYLISKNY